MQPNGLSKKAILEELQKINANNNRYADGRILCSMCTKPHPIAEKAYRMFFESNLGDPSLFSGSAQLEREVMRELASLLHSKNAMGFLVSGGTEANLMALLAARNMAKVAEPEVVLPESAHFSFIKICGLLNLKPVCAGLDAAFRVNVEEVERYVTKNTVAIVGSAGTAELGAVDPINELSTIALRRNVHLHVDAAFGGLVLPFLKETPPFDFAVDGVKSVTVDPHKMGMAAIPAGGILFKDEEALQFIQTQTPYLTDKVQYTFVGTRTGASAASTWAVFKMMGVEGFRKIVGDCLKNTALLVNRLKKAGFRLVVEPSLNVVAFRGEETKDLAEKLWKKGWFVSYIPRYDCIRIVVMPHVKKRHILALANDLCEIEKL